MSVRGPGDGGPRPGGPLEGLFVPPRHCPGGSGRARRSRSCRGTAGDIAVRTRLERLERLKFVTSQLVPERAAMRGSDRSGASVPPLDRSALLAA